MRKYQVYIFGAITLIGFPLIGYLISYFFSEHSFWDQFKSDYSLVFQVTTGVIYGVVTAILCWLVISAGMMRKARIRYISVMREMNMSYFDIVLISICAGVGEEILFRGVLQEFMGIIITSILFIAIHGYYNYKDWRISLYGLTMTIVIIGIGIIYERMGIMAPAIAHTIIDIILLTLICKGNLDKDVHYVPKDN